MVAEPDFGMEKSEMKRLLLASKREPVNCAVGITKAGVVLLMDKIKQPKLLVNQLEKKFPDMKMPHWGTAAVDMDIDPKLVVLTLNKAAPGMARKMRKSLKGTGVTKVEIHLEDGTVADKVDDDEEEEAAPQAAGPSAAAPEPEAAAPRPPAAAEAAAAPPAAPAPPDAQAAPAAPASGAPAADLSEQTRALTGLVRQLATAPNAAQLKPMAVQAQAAIKAGDAAAATTAIDALRQALGNGQAPPADAPGAAPAANTAALAKAQATWVATRKKVESELGRLHQQIAGSYKDAKLLSELERAFNARVEPMLHTLDDSLASKLGEITANTNPSNHAKLNGEAQQILKRYEEFVANDKLIAELDKNPFAPLQLQQTLNASLTALGRVIG